MGRSWFRAKRRKEGINGKIGPDTDESTQVDFYRNLFIESIEVKLKIFWSMLFHRKFQGKNETWIKALSDNEHSESRESTGQNRGMVYRRSVEIFNKLSRVLQKIIWKKFI